MKALSLWDPWGTFVADELKRFETRHWQTNYRGEIAIHVAKRWKHDQREYMKRMIGKFPTLGIYRDYQWPTGCIVATATIAQIHRTEDVRDKISELEFAMGDYSDNRYAWELTDVKKFDSPIPTNGAQGIWNWVPATPAKPLRPSFFVFENVRTADAFTKQYPELEGKTGQITDQEKLRAYWGRTYTVRFMINNRPQWWFIAHDDMERV